MDDDKQPPFKTHSMARQVADTRIILESRSFQAIGPSGGVVWNRPVAVHTQSAHGESRLPIPDVTRRGQVILYATSFLFIIAGLALGSRRP